MLPRQTSSNVGTNYETFFFFFFLLLDPPGDPGKIKLKLHALSFETEMHYHIM